MAPVIVWFRQDLRVADNPALAAAAATGRPVLALYILDDETPGAWRMGAASRWWLHGSLYELGKGLEKRGARLIQRRGEAATVLGEVIAETGAEAVYWNRCYEPYAIARDTAIKAALKKKSVAAESFNAALLFEPWELQTQSGTPFKVFTPFHKAALHAAPPRRPLSAPKAIAGYTARIKSDALDGWNLLPRKPDWARGFRSTWTPGEAGAVKRLNSFLDDAVSRYAQGRDLPGREYTSRLSAHLHFGDISPHHVWHAALGMEQNASTATFLKELVWREFAHHLLFHFPALPGEPLRAEFARFPWKADARALKAWQRGQTGVPIVDAGMRELWATGWMHNRVRMIAASFLVKHLLQPWQTGAAWFWDTLVDADLANNSASWQWVAGCGTDAAPYFRIFNPVLQGEKFDQDGDYVRRWVPEIAKLPNAWVHKPWIAPDDALAGASVRLGETYPAPIIDLGHGRTRALEAFQRLKTAA